MVCRSTAYIRKALGAAKELTILADEGEAESADDGCSVLFGVIRDCAYKIRQQAEMEMHQHKMRGVWEAADAHKA